MPQEEARLENKIAEMAIDKGCETPTELLERTDEIGRSTIFELWANPERYPDKESQLAICKAFKCQPGEFLTCVFPQDDQS